MYHPESEAEANAMQAEMDADAQGQYEHEQQCQGEAEAQAAAEHEAEQERLKVPNTRELVEKIEAYSFECEACGLKNCKEWQELRSFLVREGELTPDEVQKHIASVLDSLSYTLLSLDAADVEDETKVHAHEMNFTAQNAMDALHIFTSIVSNIRIQRYLRKQDRTQEEDALFSENTVKLGEAISEIFGTFTGIDSRSYYQTKND